MHRSRPRYDTVESEWPVELDSKGHDAGMMRIIDSHAAAAEQQQQQQRRGSVGQQREWDGIILSRQVSEGTEQLENETSI